MSESRNHSWYLLLAALGITVLMCISICAVFTGHRLASQQPNEPDSEGLPSAADATSAPEAPVKEAVRWSVVLPPDYNPEQSYPVVFEYATREPQLVNLQPGQAILASFAAQTDTPLKASLSEANALAQLAALQKEYHLDEDRIYLVTADLAGLAFASRHASSFSAAVLQFTQNPAADAWKDLPLDNLNNLEFCIDTSRLPLPDASLRKLYDELELHLRPMIAMYEYPIAHPSSPLPEMLSLLSMTLPLHHDRIHWQTDSISNGEAWWLRAERLENYGKPATFWARYEPDDINSVALQIRIKTTNLNALALKRTWKDFKEVRTFILTIDDQRIFLPTRSIDPEWCVIRKKDGNWQADSAEPTELCKSASCEGPIAHLFQGPFLIIPGTADTDTAAMWQQSAQDLAQRWKEATGQTATILPDSACTSQTLAGHHLVLLGSPRENLLVNNLLDEHPEFLREIYLRNHSDDDATETPETARLCCLSLYPAAPYSSGKLALIVLADHPSDIGFAWQPLFTTMATQGDYLLFQPNETANGETEKEWDNVHDFRVRAVGWFSSTWEMAD